jgi:DNA polymerase
VGDDLELPWDATSFLPEQRTLESLRRAAAECRACDLYRTGTQTVFGEGPTQQADVMFVGEQPGNQEDRQGHPFVGPAGRVLDEALEEVGIDRSRVYVTNAVKHFKWVPKGKARIHAKPNAREIRACRPWLDEELDLVEPRVIVVLGATAAQALLGRQFRVSKQRGELVESPLAESVIATVHPSSILRSDNREAEFAELVRDLQKVADAVGET